MNEKEQEFSFKDLFIPLTTTKAIIFIIVIGFLVFFNSLFNGFVGDDWGQVVDNVTVHSLQNVFDFFTRSTFYINGAGSFGVYYKPLMMVIYSFLYSLFGQQAFFYHLTQLLLHIANSCLLFVFFKRFFKKELSFLLSLVFLIHPANSETVLYVANMQEVLFFLFGIISLLILEKSTRVRDFIFVGALWFLSLLSKETGILFVLMSSIYNYLFKKNKYVYLVAFTIIIFYLLLRAITIGFNFNNSDIYIVANGNFVERLISIPKIILFYLSLFFYPLNLTIQQNWIVKILTINNFYLLLLLDIVFFVCIALPLIFFYKKRVTLFKEYIFFFGWFLFGLCFHVQILPLDATVSGRWFYFPMVGLLGMFGVLLKYLWSRINKEIFKKLLAIALVAVLILLSYRSFVRSFDYRNDFTLCSHDAKIDTQNYVLELCLGNEYRKLKQFDIARMHLGKSIALFPKYYIAMYYLALSYNDQNNYNEAIKYFRQTLNNNSWGYGADQLATLLAYHGKYQESKIVAMENLKKQPRNGMLWYALSLADYKLGFKDEALEAAKNAHNIVHNNLTEDVLDAILRGVPIRFNNKP